MNKRREERMVRGENRKVNRLVSLARGMAGNFPCFWFDATHINLGVELISFYTAEICYYYVAGVAKDAVPLWLRF